ncbi:MAG: DUF4382 domain-containing protein [Candidatus Aminicenantes bacterium]|nr:DUF4382 domain-containing protein [Candidatus Aminicenantes bacterium]MDH5384670.1 DUF4382 domain-containing protein [Candidatus Aminicenantes bacterium]
MKKRISLVICFLFIVCFIYYCKAPTSSEAVFPEAASKTDSSSSSNSGSSGGGIGGSTQGSFILLMKDKPVEDAEKILVTVDEIRVHMASPESFIRVVLDEEKTFDLLLLKNKTESIVENADLKTGHYNQIRMSVVSGEIVFLEENGEGGEKEVKYDLEIPSSEIKIPVEFDMEADAKVTVLLDFDAEDSIKVTKQGKKDSYKLRPVIKVVSVSYQP